MNERKICPLLFASSADIEDFECRPDRCAWWNKSANACAIAANACAIAAGSAALLSIGNSLEEIADQEDER